MFFRKKNEQTQRTINVTLIALLTDLEVEMMQLKETLEEVRNDLDFVLDSIEEEYGN